MSDAGHSRRAFFGAGWRRALDAGLKASEKRGLLGPDDPGDPEIPEPPVQGTIPGAPSSGKLTLDDVLAMAAEAGLEARVDDVRAFARRSLRLTPAAPGAETGRSRLGGVPDIPAGFAWPTTDGLPLRFLAQLDLDEIRALDPDAPVEGLETGLLLVFAGHETTARWLDPDAAASTRVLLAEGPVTRAAAPWAKEAAPARPVRASAEWQLPREWSAAVVALGLSTEERDAWREVRQRVAAEQGVELYDRTRGLLAVHRLLGLPDERRGDMPLICELLEAGELVDHRGPRLHPDAGELEARAARWRLLAQLSVDDRLGWEWGADPDRLYLWIDEAALAEGDFTGVRGIAQ